MRPVRSTSRPAGREPTTWFPRILRNPIIAVSRSRRTCPWLRNYVIASTKPNPPVGRGWDGRHPECMAPCVWCEGPRCAREFHSWISHATPHREWPPGNPWPAPPPDDICRSYFLTSPSWSMATEARRRLLCYETPRGLLRGMLSAFTHDNSSKKLHQHPHRLPRLLLLVHWTIPVPISVRTRPSGIDSYPRYMTRYRLKQGIRVTAAIAIASVSASALVMMPAHP